MSDIESNNNPLIDSSEFIHSELKSILIKPIPDNNNQISIYINRCIIIFLVIVLFVVICFTVLYLYSLIK